MIVFKLSRLFSTATLLEQCRSRAVLREREKNETLIDEDLEMFKNELKLVTENCHALNLAFTLDQLERFVEIDLKKEPRITYQSAKVMLTDIMTRFHDELKRQGLGFVIETAQIHFYERPADQFSEEVLNNFPSARMDIEEAGRCFALERYSATVFHLMRVLELGLIALARPFAVPADRKNWHNILNEIQSAVNKMDQSSGPTWRDDQQYYSALVVEFRFFKNAWRNQVMHIHDHYSKESASNIFQHVNFFMRKASEKLKE